ncbi:hypothetical protein CR51_22815 [Caballeronia megalochromosomata]|nr:hypothetical protein CR51_22815 [Caballeronia megalochromosomata]
MMLYLNFEGVLHPATVRFIAGLSPELNFRGHHLFENVGALASVIATIPDLEITLNTWWTYHTGIRETIALLPSDVAQRVSASTIPHSSKCNEFPNRTLLASQAAQSDSQPFVLLDHAGARYPCQVRSNCFFVDPVTGLGDERALHALSTLLKQH